jgi:hypothetical protein
MVDVELGLLLALLPILVIFPRPVLQANRR